MHDAAFSTLKNELIIVSHDMRSSNIQGGWIKCSKFAMAILLKRKLEIIKKKM